MLAWPPKDPNETLDYSIDWSQRLVTGDFLVTSSWSASSPSGLTVNSNSFAATSTTVFLSGGTLGTVYTLTNTVTTHNGDTEVETVAVQMRAK